LSSAVRLLHMRSDSCVCLYPLNRHTKVPCFKFYARNDVASKTLLTVVLESSKIYAVIITILSIAQFIAKMTFDGNSRSLAMALIDSMDTIPY